MTISFVGPLVSTYWGLSPCSRSATLRRKKSGYLRNITELKKNFRFNKN